MAQTSPWPIIHAERQALLADLAPLTPAQWSTQSLCEAWTVEEVLGHMVATARLTPPKFLMGLAANGFKFNAMTAKSVARETADGPTTTVAHFKEVAAATTHPPGPIDAMLGEMILHSEDIRRPLGIKHNYPMDAVVRVADFYKGSNLLLGSKKRIDGLTLKASDASWSHGTGPVVEGPALSLVLAMTGRKSGLAELSGDGLSTLSTRM